VIAVDTSSWIAFLAGDEGADVALVDRALADRQVVVPPVVLTELLSDPKLPQSVAALLREIPVLHPLPGFWERAGLLRAGLIAQGRKARLADSLIAQSCLDQEISLVTRDSDFRHFARSGGLALLP
jgi:predicted nucleic acid-binding protein